MPTLRRAALALVVLAAAAEPASAWDPAVRLKIVDESVRLMPASLRRALERHAEDVRRGMLEPMADEDAPGHVPTTGGGSADAEVAAAARGLVEAVETPLPFREVARRFGRLAHFVTDCTFPPNASGKAGAGRYEHFTRFASSRSAKFPTVFYGHDDPDLVRRDFAAFGRRIAAEAASADQDLGRAYAAAGTPPDPRAFDDRSIPFAVASLSYQRSVTYVVRAWLEAWREAGGDVGFTPYLRPDSHERSAR